MPFFSRMFELPFFQFLLPDRLKPVLDEYVSDQYTHLLLQETELFIDSIIDLSELDRSNRVFKKKTEQSKILLKIRSKRLKLDFSDQKQSDSPIKKRIIIDLYRKKYKTKNNLGKIVEATIYYTYQGHSFVRSVKRSPYLQRIFLRLDQLDNALSGIQIGKLEQPLINEQPKLPDQKEQELKELILYLKRWYGLDPLIENKLKKIVTLAEKISPEFALLEIETRYLIKRILSDEVPTLLQSYQSLTPKLKLEQKENIFIALSRMEMKLTSQIEELERKKLERIEHLLRVNKQRYDK